MSKGERHKEVGEEEGVGRRERGGQVRLEEGPLTSVIS